PSEEIGDLRRGRLSEGKNARVLGQNVPLFGLPGPKDRFSRGQMRCPGCRRMQQVVPLLVGHRTLGQTTLILRLKEPVFDSLIVELLVASNGYFGLLDTKPVLPDV